MAVTYRLANEEDIEDLVNFRWKYAYQIYGFERKEMCSFRGGFRYFVRTGFKDGYRCLIALDDGKIVGTVYWQTIEGMKSYKERKKEKGVYIHYLDVFPQNETIKNELLDRVMDICHQEKVRGVYAFQNMEVQDCLLQKGFIPHMDYLKMRLAG